MFVNLEDTSSWRLEKRVKEHMLKGYVLVDGIHRDRDWMYRCSMQLDPAVTQQRQAEIVAKKQQEKEAWDTTKKKAWDLAKKAARKAKATYNSRNEDKKVSKNF